MSLRIDTGALLVALDDHTPEMVHYLDLQTGEVIPAPFGAFIESDPEYAELEAMQDNPRYRPVEPAPSGEGWRWMRDFIDQLTDPDVQEELERAIHRNRPFRHFKDALSGFPELRQAWFRFQEKRLLEYARDWLALEEIDAELAPLPERKPDLRLVQ